MVSPCSEPAVYQKRIRHTLHSIGVGFAFFLLLCLHSKYSSSPLCLIKRVLHISCAGCGLTSGFQCILQGNITGAWEHNILSFPLFVGITAYIICAIVDMIFRSRCITHIESFLSKKIMLIFYGVLFIATTIINNL